jgi:hypothetical protein
MVDEHKLTVKMPALARRLGFVLETNAFNTGPGLDVDGFETDVYRGLERHGTDLCDLFLADLQWAPGWAIGSTEGRLDHQLILPGPEAQCDLPVVVGRADATGAKHFAITLGSNRRIFDWLFCVNVSDNELSIAAGRECVIEHGVKTQAADAFDTFLSCGDRLLYKMKRRSWIDHGDELDLAG